MELAQEPFEPEEGRRLLDQLCQADVESTSAGLAPAEAAVVVKALNSTLDELTWDFEIRMGATTAQARELRASLLGQGGGQ